MFIKLKIQNIFIYSILAIGLISIPSLLDTVQAQINMTNATSSSLQNQTAAQTAVAGANQTAQTAQNQTAVAAVLTKLLKQHRIKLLLQVLVLTKQSVQKPKH